jgi:hypothetical protein
VLDRYATVVFDRYISACGSISQSEESTLYKDVFWCFTLLAFCESRRAEFLFQQRFRKLNAYFVANLSDRHVRCSGGVKKVDVYIGALYSNGWGYAAWFSWHT